MGGHQPPGGKPLKKASISERFAYIFDNMLSNGPLSLISWLAALSAVIILVVALFVQIFHADPELSFPAVVWTMLLQALAPNPVDVKAGPVGFLAAMLVITLAGIFMVSIFIGILTTSIEERVQLLRKGRSKVLETGHIVILGWDEHIYTIIHELTIASEAERRTCVVVLGEKDKIDMEDEIREKVGSTGRMKVVCRSGSPIEQSALDIVSINTAKSIIILAPDSEDPDPFVIKTLLAITNSPKRKKEPYHIVAEIHDLENVEAAHIVGNGEAELLLINDIVARIIAQTTRQSGLSTVYVELLNFEGDEIYFKQENNLAGKTFRQALMAYEDSSVIGLHCAEDGKTRLNPPSDTLIQAGDQIIAISEDQNTVIINGKGNALIQRDAIQLAQPAPLIPERTLILGWNQYAEEIILELDRYVAQGSQVKVVSDKACGYPTAEFLAKLQNGRLNQFVEIQDGNTSNSLVLENLEIETYQHVIVLAYSDTLGIQASDARTLITLLHLRKIDEAAGHPFSIVSEMRDGHNRTLAEVTHADDFVVSDNIASLIMAQLSENAELNVVFADLFNKGGADVYMKPVKDYLRLDKPVNFYTVVEAARLRGEVAFGYRLAQFANDSGRNFGVVTNPNKSEEIQFTEKDRLIVLASS
jgi:ion channel POLLUX/CASTOR